MRLGLLLAATLLASLFAGCAATKDTPSSSPSTASGTHHGTTTAATTTPAVQRTAVLKAAPANGTAPLNVTFTIDALGKDNRTTWRLAFGDGQDANGTAAQLPANRTHAFAVGGNFTAKLLVTYAGGATANATLVVKVKAVVGADYPKVFTFGASKLGCVGDAHSIADAPLNCVNFQGGPTSPQVDGFWQALDARYAGKAFTSTLATANPMPDSDCYFVAADAETITGDCTNGGDLAAGTVPAGTAWMFIYPYAAPADGIVVTFA
jgi:hypothetical protein